MELKPGSHIYFMGIGGTGMAAVAGLFKEAGFQISGSDKGIYPPMSDMLGELNIPYRCPYAPENLDTAQPDMVVVANALSRGNPELEHLLKSNIAYTSFPALLGSEILQNRSPLVVAGTHGKTTTTSLLAHVLTELKEQPGFLIGGIPHNFNRSFSLGKGTCFAIEGDEYDTAFFDKNSKFLHYRPKYLILNNLEFDHADIFRDLEAIEAQFAKLCALVPNPKNIIANVDDSGMRRFLEKNDLISRVTQVSTLGQTPGAQVVVDNIDATHPQKIWSASIKTQQLGTIAVQTQLFGNYNIANIAQIIALVERIAHDGVLQHNLTPDNLIDAIRSFRGVKRRLEKLAEANGVSVYEDFAHHPTAIQSVIAGFRKSFPERRLIVAFEPANATGRRNVLQNDFAKALANADQVLVGKCPVDARIPADEKMNTEELAQAIGTHKARAFAENEDLLQHLVNQLEQGDAVIFMSPGSFSGIQHQLAKRLTESK